MASIRFSLIFLFLFHVFIGSTRCALPTDSDVFVNDIPSLIRKMKILVNEFDCRKEWIYLGGSCYSLSNMISTSIEANETCHLVHSNDSNLMQIRNTIELFYAVHILMRKNLSALMIEIDRQFFNEQNIHDLLSEHEWKRMRNKFRQDQIKYHKLRKNLFDELNSISLRMSTRDSKKFQSFLRKQNQNFTRNNFEQMENIERICDEIDWNVLNSNSTVYLLSASSISNRTVCSLSDVQSGLKYKHICEYVLDYCFANDQCGKHGHCINTLKDFTCSCSFLYSGRRCERISKQGKQIIVSLIIILVFCIFSIRVVKRTLAFTIELCVRNVSVKKSRSKHKRETRNIDNEVVSEEMVSMNRKGKRRRPTTRQNTEEHQPISSQLTSSRKVALVKNPNKCNLVRLICVSGLTIINLILIISLTSFKDDIVNETNNYLGRKCQIRLYYPIVNLIFAVIALVLIMIFSWSVKRENRCLDRCNGRPGLLPPIEPFRTVNRFSSAAVFAIITFQLFEELIFISNNIFIHGGVLIQMFRIISVIILIGIRYYPIVASLQLQNIIVRFLACVYVILNIVYIILLERFCKEISILSTYYSMSETVKVQPEFGRWIVNYKLIKNIPQFVFLSFICAELCVRFAYDSIYLAIKEKRKLWSISNIQSDEFVFAKFYVTKLFRSNGHSNEMNKLINIDVDRLDQFESERELQRIRNLCLPRRFFTLTSFEKTHFRFPTIATCTYTVAIVVLYYFACALLFLYIHQAKDYTSTIQSYLERIFNIEFQEFVPLRSSIIITSTIISVVIMTCHLFIAIINYRKHKIQIFKGIYTDIPSAINFSSDSMTSRSIHYSGFLVGHTACGFLIYFHVILFISIAIELMFLKIPYVQFLLKIIVSVFTLYLLIMIVLSRIGRCSLLYTITNQFYFRNRQFYSIYIYFSFIIDCFLGIAVCIVRLVKGIIFNLFYLGRLDYTFYGRSIEKFDIGYAAYVSYLHVEAAHTNPIVLAFCYSIFEDICCRRSQYSDNDQITIEHKSNDNLSNFDNSSMIGRAGSEVEPVPRISTTNLSTNNLLLPEQISKRIEIIKRKRARFHWFLAYTLINNYFLFDLRKSGGSRVTALRMMQSYSVHQEYFPSNSAVYQPRLQTISNSFSSNSNSSLMDERNTEYRNNPFNHHSAI